MKREQKKEKRNNKVKRLIFLAIIPMIMMMFGVYHFIRENNITDTLNGGVGIMIDSNARSYQLLQNDSGKEQDVAISGIGDMTINANEKEIAVDFYNPKQNENLYYLTFELRIYDDTKRKYETLYTSGLIAPGSHIYKITLLHELESGVYDAVVHIQPYRMNQEKTPTNNADIKTKLIVK